MKTTWDNPDLYRRLSAPYPDESASAVALENFKEGVTKLREECGIANMAVIASVFVMHDGVYGVHEATVTMGDQHHCESMLQRRFKSWLTNWMDENRDILDLIGFKGSKP